MMQNNNNLNKNSPSSWCRIVDSYFARWISLNRPFFELSKNFLPDIPAQSYIHIPGVGPGFELGFLLDLYPNAHIFASDTSPGMIQKSKNETSAPFYFIGDISNVALKHLSASISYFTVHLVRDSFLSIKSQYYSLAPGGKLFSVYFPPTPTGKTGPLVSLHRASHQLFPRPDSDWEAQSFDYLNQQGASDVNIIQLKANWGFDSIDDLRKALELLPHISHIKHRAGEAFYNKLWSLCLDDPGLSFDGTRWIGPVGASILTATKS